MSIVTEPETVRDAIEAHARIEMARVAAIPARGWDSERRRREVIEDIDVLLDQFNSLGG